MSEIEIPEFTNVESSNILSISYDAQNEFLYVKFKPGKSGVPAVYRHAQVPAQVYNGLMASFSKGKFYHSQVRGQFPISKLD